jgi:TolA-binding protein
MSARTSLPRTRALAAVAVSLAVCTPLLGGCFAQQRDYDALSARTAQDEKELAQSRADLNQLRADLEATRQRLDNALRASADSSSDLVASKERLNTMAGRFDELQHGLDELKRDVAQSRSEIYSRIDDLKRTQPAAVAAPPPIAIPADKAAHLAQLEQAYGKKDWPTVRALAPEFVNRYPTDEHADVALFDLGDCDLQDGRPSSALASFNRLLKLFPRSRYLDRTLFDMGEAYLAMHDCAGAKAAYEACDKRFPKEKAGIDSRAKLAVIAKNAPGTCAPP